MGHADTSVESAALWSGLPVKRRSPNDRVIAIAGNPNVGKSTVFNALTGMRQHTGNWPGKTVCAAQGHCETRRHSYVLVDVPGTYSLAAHSPEEEVTRDTLCFGAPDGVVVVCDATCLERNLNLALQAMEVSRRVVVCVNLMDEAKKKGVVIDLDVLEKKLGVPVIGVVARRKRTLERLTAALDGVMDAPRRSYARIPYPPPIESALTVLEPILTSRIKAKGNPRWLALRLLDADPAFLRDISAAFALDLEGDAELSAALGQVKAALREADVTESVCRDLIASAVVRRAEAFREAAVSCPGSGYSPRDRRIDRVLTGRATGYPVMAGLLLLIFWLTIQGANVPSALLADLLFRLQNRLSALFLALGAPPWLHDACVLGAYRVLAWVTAVMLPPMAIFFPLFTLLEDSGYLPRIAYNLDRSFKRCRACGKQALTMCSVFFRVSSRA